MKQVQDFIPYVIVGLVIVFAVYRWWQRGGGGGGQGRGRGRGRGRGGDSKDDRDRDRDRDRGDVRGERGGERGHTFDADPSRPGRPGISRLPFRRADFADIRLVAAREIRERARGRIFRVGTALLLAVIAAAIVIPVLAKGKPHVEHVGVVGALSAPARSAITADAVAAGTTVAFTAESGPAAARAAVSSGRLDLAVLDGHDLIVNSPAASASAPASSAASADTATGQFIRAVSDDLGVAQAFQSAALTPSQAARIAAAKPVPVTSLSPSTAKTSSAAADTGMILIFLMLTQYNTWTLLGVMEEKSSRVVEVILAAIRPGRLLAGKVAGIAAVAFAQAAIVVGFAAGLSAAVGSGLLKGTAPWFLAGILLWLVLGYGFYCWLYAAAGSMTERRDQVQSLALPLSVPVMFGFFTAQSALGSGHPTAFLKVLAYLPPTAPFAMPTLVSLGAVAWWQVVASALISVLCTVAVAVLASGIYRRAILRTGRRVPLRDVLTSAAPRLA